MKRIIILLLWPAMLAGYAFQFFAIGFKAGQARMTIVLKKRFGI